MRALFTLTKHELRTLFLGTQTYVALTFFLILMGALYLLILEGFATSPQESLPQTQFLQTFWLPTLFIVPMLTMRSLSEEQHLGTLDALMSTPITVASIILSKFLAAYLFYLLAWGLSLLLPLFASSYFPGIANAQLLLDAPSTIGGFLFIGLSGCFFIAIGILISSLNNSSLAAGTGTFCILFLMILGSYFLKDSEAWQGMGWIQPSQALIDYLNSIKHLEDFSRGIIDTRPLVFYLGNTLVALSLACMSLESRH